MIVATCAWFTNANRLFNHTIYPSVKQYFNIGANIKNTFKYSWFAPASGMSIRIAKLWNKFKKSDYTTYKTWSDDTPVKQTIHNCYNTVYSFLHYVSNCIIENKLQRFHV